MNFVLQIVFLALGFFLLVKGADWFVDGASGLARKLGIPQLVIGLTIVAMGTSLPEAAVSISAALRGNAEITIGNIVGSNILNILIILGVTALIATLKVADSTVRYEIPFMIVVTFVLLWLGYTGGQVTWLEGVILWVLFLLYLRYLYMMAKKGKEEEREVEQLSTAKIIGLILAGVVMIVAGSNFAVEGASNLAKALGISQRFIGLTIVALGTSLPELVTSVSAARKHNADIAIGNIVGSNIFNILFIVGTTALITPVTFASGFVVDTLIAAAVGILLFVCVARTKELRKKAGIVMLLAYILYFLYLL
ncbi:calcium/sodium antiporter [Roseburia sp. AM16-25]|jgi:cation:H+ antiporter|uniref:calcium/sodium antiporter n=1 Tax=Roseburia sp. AM16-25 TaxID=2292065 RepID=UPI000E5400E6|nr:calcium/sodium antiporter [Roseburia sp. AM16-25]RHO29460.1 sodium:calcium antiporter [Roseburia sp. AM16-25]